MSLTSKFKYDIFKSWPAVYSHLKKERHDQRLKKFT